METQEKYYKRLLFVNLNNLVFTSQCFTFAYFMHGWLDYLAESSKPEMKFFTVISNYCPYMLKFRMLVN